MAWISASIFDSAFLPLFWAPDGALFISADLRCNPDFFRIGEFGLLFLSGSSFLVCRSGGAGFIRCILHLTPRGGLRLCKWTPGFYVSGAEFPERSVDFGWAS